MKYCDFLPDNFDPYSGGRYAVNSAVKLRLAGRLWNKNGEMVLAFSSLGNLVKGSTYKQDQILSQPISIQINLTRLGFTS